MPGTCNPGCAAGCVPAAMPPPAGAVGAYEGGLLREMRAPIARCPAATCATISPFCPVCTRVIRQTFAPYLPAESVALLTPGIDFGGVPEGLGGIGVTLHRADPVRSDDMPPGCISRSSPGPTGGFGTPHGTTPAESAARRIRADRPGAPVAVLHVETAAGAIPPADR